MEPMETIKIKINVSREVALANSQTQFGAVEYAPTADELATLTGTQRAVLERVLSGFYSTLIESTVAPVTWWEIVRVLDAAAIAEAELQEACSRFAVAADAAIANPDPTALLERVADKWFVVDHGEGGAYNEFGSIRVQHPLGKNCDPSGRYMLLFQSPSYNTYAPSDARYSDRYKSILSRLEKEAERRTVALREQWQTRMSAASPEELARLSHSERRNLSAENEQRLAAYLSAQRANEEANDRAKAEENRSKIEAALQSSPAHVLGRWRDGRLPESELKRALCDVAFAAIDLQRYVKISDSELSHSEDCRECYEPDPRVSSSVYTGDLDAEEWESWIAEKAVIEAAGFDPELRQVRLYCANDGCDNVVTKLQARVATEIGGVSLVRSYAIG